MEPFKYIFSRPERSPWKPVPTSNKEATFPVISIRPFVGGVIRDNIFNSVDFPAPFRPIIPTLSPLSISKFTSFKAQKSCVSFF